MILLHWLAGPPRLKADSVQQTPGAAKDDDVDLAHKSSTLRTFSPHRVSPSQNTNQTKSRSTSPNGNSSPVAGKSSSPTLRTFSPPSRNTNQTKSRSSTSPNGQFKTPSRKVQRSLTGSRGPTTPEPNYRSPNRVFSKDWRDPENAKKMSPFWKNAVKTLKGDDFSKMIDMK